MSFSAKTLAATESPSPGGVDSGDFSTNEEAVPLHYFTGEDWCPLSWLLPEPLNIVSKDVKQEVGKGQETTTGQEFWCDVAGLMCVGLIDAVTGFETGGSVTWEGTVTRPDNPAHPDYWRAEIHVPEATLYVYWGRPDQPRDDILLGPLTAAHPDLGHPAYRHQAYAVLVKYYQGKNSSSVRNTRVRARRAPRPTIGTFAPRNSSQGESMVASILELATSPIFGVGFAASKFTASEWETLSTAVVAGVGCHSPSLDRARPFKDVVKDWCTYFDGFVRIKNGQLRPGWHPHDGTTPAGLTTLDMHDFRGFPTVEVSSPSDTVNSVWVVYRDRNDFWKRKPAKGSESANIHVRRAVDPVIMEMLAIIDGTQALRYAAEASSTGSEGQMEGDGVVRKSKLKWASGQRLQAGDNFVFDCAILGVNQVARIKRRTDPFRGSPSIEFESERGVFPLPYVPSVDTRPIPADPIPQAIARVRIWEVTRELFGNTNGVPIAIIAQRPKSVAPGAYALTGKDVVQFVGHISADGATYDSLYKGIHWGVYATIREVVPGTGVDAVIKVSVPTDNLDFDRLVSQSAEAKANDTLLLLVGEEIFSVGQITLSGYNLDLACKRARQGTVFSAHAVNDAAWFFYRAELNVVDSLLVAQGATRYFKLQPYTRKMSLALVDTPVVTYAFSDRTPAAPTGVTATAGTGKIISISWSINVPAHVAEFYVFRHTANISAAATQIGTVRGTRFIDVDVVFGSLYYYWVKSVSDRGDLSVFSNVSSATAVAAVGPQGPQGDPGPSGDFTAHIFKRSAVQPSAPNTPVFGGAPIPDNGVPAGWSDGPPAGTLPLWMTTNRQTTAGVSLYPWPNPVRIDADSTFVEFSVTGTGGWHSVFTAGDLYMRTKVGADGAWSAAIRIVGEQGQASYFHVAYADSANGATNFNQISGAYIGTYVDFTPADSTDYHAYTWRLIKGLQGDQGVPGTNGANGQTSYLHIKYSNDGGTTFTGSGGEDVGAWIGTVVNFTLADPTSPSAYTWGQVNGYKDSTPPDDPLAPTMNTGGAYTTSDGSVLAWVLINIPAMPTNGETMNLIYRRTGSSGWMVAAQVSVGGGTCEIDGLSTGQSYQFGIQAYSAYGKPSNVVLGSPASGVFTAPTKGTRPPAPTSLSVAAPAFADGFPPTYQGTQLNPGAWLTLPVAPIVDAALFEWRVMAVTTPVDNEAVDTTMTVPVGTAKVPIYTSPSYFAAKVYGRWVDRSGLKGAWSSPGTTVPWNMGYMGNAGIQDSDDFHAQGLAIADSGGVLQTAQWPFGAIYVCGAGGLITISIPSGVFLFKPKWASIDVIEPPLGNYRATYVKNHASNSATVAIVQGLNPDGTALIAGQVLELEGIFGAY